MINENILEILLFFFLVLFLVCMFEVVLLLDGFMNELVVELSVYCVDFLERFFGCLY